MIGILLFILFFVGGICITRWQLPTREPLTQIVVGLSIGLFLLMWLPMLWAYFFTFSVLSHIFALLTLFILVILSYIWRDKTPPLPFDSVQKQKLITILIMVIPLTLLSCYLQYTHNLRITDNGGYAVGQSTYGDLSLHLAIATSAVHASFPLHNSLMLGASMAYPYLSDTIASTLLLFNCSLPFAMTFTGSIMMIIVYLNYAVLLTTLCKHKKSVYLAFFLFFLNGGLGFFLTLNPEIVNNTVISFYDKIELALSGFYKTPTNQPIPYNLRWVNFICDMLVPQRGILGGFTILIPCFILILPPVIKTKNIPLRTVILVGILAGGMPLIHTHSYLALVLSSFGLFLYCVLTRTTSLYKCVKSWILYAGIACAFSLPLLITFTFNQALNSNHFLRFQFNWCNNINGKGLVDPYFWFYIKNIGLPYIFIILALFQRKKEGCKINNKYISQNRLIACGAFFIYIIAEFIVFQPNEYDNNKLFYVWFLLCLPMASDYIIELYRKLKGIAGRRIIAFLFIFVCFFSATVTIARETISDYNAYYAHDITCANWIKENTAEHSVFLTGDQHLNPVSSLAGRTILCSSDIYLFLHGFNTLPRKEDIKKMYEAPLENKNLFLQYNVEYIYISSYETNSQLFKINTDEIKELFPLVYKDNSSSQRIYQVIWDN